MQFMLYYKSLIRVHRILSKITHSLTHSLTHSTHPTHPICHSLTHLISQPTNLSLTLIGSGSRYYKSTTSLYTIKHDHHPPDAHPTAIRLVVELALCGCRVSAFSITPCCRFCVVAIPVRVALPSRVGQLRAHAAGGNGAVLNSRSVVAEQRLRDG